MVDRSVALLNGQVMTASELDFEARVLLIFAGGVQAASAPLDFAVLKDSLDQIITQRVLAQEAEKLGAYLLEPAELDQAMEQFRARFTSKTDFNVFLERHEADETQLSAILSRFLRAQRFLDGKLRLKANVSEADAQKFRNEHSEFKDQNIAAIQKKLFEERYRALARTEIRQLRKSSKVRLLGPYAAGSPDAG